MLVFELGPGGYPSCSFVKSSTNDVLLFGEPDNEFPAECG